MSDEDNAASTGDEFAALKAHAAVLERRLREVQVETTGRLVQAELKAEAVRAGIIDLDGLKLVDATSLNLGESGDVIGAADVIAKLRRDKPWLFGTGSSSSIAQAPPSSPPRQKLATEMTIEEWRAARAELLRRR